MGYFKKTNGYESNGLWYPRVTSICNVIAKPGLERWLANQESFSAMQKKRKRITDWGKLIHQVIEDMLLGKNPKIEKEIQPSIDAFLEWQDENKVKTFAVEKKVVSQKHSYIGTPDVIAEINGKLGILELKTSQDVWDEYFIQTAAYMQAYNEKALEKAKTQWILRIDQYQECCLCGAKKRKKAGEVEIKSGKKRCSHKWQKTTGFYEMKEINNHALFTNAFFTAKKLWEFSNRNQLLKIKNYPDRFKHA
jgi:hypothetical protein